MKLFKCRNLTSCLAGPGFAGVEHACMHRIRFRKTNSPGAGSSSSRLDCTHTLPPLERANMHPRRFRTGRQTTFPSSSCFSCFFFLFPYFWWINTAKCLRRRDKEICLVGFLIGCGLISLVDIGEKECFMNNDMFQNFSLCFLRCINNWEWEYYETYFRLICFKIFIW